MLRNYSSKAQLIDGKALANSIKSNLQQQIAQLNQKPHLCLIQIGDQQDSTNYVNMKYKTAVKLGMNCDVIRLPKETTTANLEKQLDELNSNDDVDGVLVQLPIPEHIDHEVLESVIKEKDVDGFGRFNLAELNKVHGEPLFKPCTPEGCLRLIETTGVKLAGKHAVVIGRGDVVGRPMSTMLLNNDCTVTTCHSKTENLKDLVKLGDIVIAAAGKANLVQKDWVKPGAVVIDVGINYVDDSTDKRGYKIYGDVSKDVEEVASFLTPVPGGVGPMTITMLMENVVISAKRRQEQKKQSNN